MKYQSLSKAMASLTIALAMCPYVCYSQTSPAGFSEVLNLPPDSLPGTVLKARVSNAQVNVFTGGVIEDRSFEANFDSELNVFGGEINGGLRVTTNSTANFYGGTIGGEAEFANSHVNVQGGDFSGLFFLDNQSTANVSGGSFDSFFEVFEEAEATISGGQFNGTFTAHQHSTVNIIAREFYLDGVPLELERGVTQIIEERDVVLRAVLLDYSEFEILLDSTDLFEPNRPVFLDLMDTLATLTITSVPEPEAICLLLMGAMVVGLPRYRLF